MQPSKAQLVLIAPGVWLISRRLRFLAGVYFALVAPIVVRLNNGVSGS